MGFPRQEYWSGLPFSSPGDLPNPGIEPVFPALADGSFTTEPVRLDDQKWQMYWRSLGRQVCCREWKTDRTVFQTMGLWGRIWVPLCKYRAHCLAESQNSWYLLTTCHTMRPWPLVFSTLQVRQEISALTEGIQGVTRWFHYPNSGCFNCWWHSFKI